MEIIMYRWQSRLWEQDDTTDLVPWFTCYVTGPSGICRPGISMERQDLRPKAQLFKWLGIIMLKYLSKPYPM